MDEFVDEFQHSKATPFDTLWRLWKNYIGWYVVGNEHLKRTFFHIFLGCVLTNNNCGYMESARQRSLRMHTFVIQNSGTGKSQTMRATRDLLVSLGIQAEHTTKDNEAAAVGTIWRDKQQGEYHVKKGKLAHLMYYSWDEGSVLLKPSSYMDIMTDHFQRAMDEPGEVSKSLAMGTISFETPTTIVAGSVMFKEFKETLVSKGYLQRMLMSYKQFTPEEEREIRIGVNLLKLLVKTNKIESIRSAMALQIAKLPHSITIQFDPDSTKLFNERLEEIYQQYIEYSFSSQKEEILKTFFNRLHILMDKIAAQHALLSGHDKVMYDDMMYAHDLLVTTKYIPNPHIFSIHRLFEELTIHGGGQNMTQNRVSIITSKIDGNPGINQKQLLDYLKTLYMAGKWDFGSNKSRELIRLMLEDKVLAFIPGAKSEKVLKVVH